MNDGAIVPTCLGRSLSLRVLIGIASNPITTTRRLHIANRRYVILHYPHSRYSHPQILACVADPGLYRIVASNSEAWRSVNVGMRAFKNHAANRLNLSVRRLRGPRHAHYRRLLALPLSKARRRRHESEDGGGCGAQGRNLAAQSGDRISLSAYCSATIALAAILSCHRVALVPHARIDHRTAITLIPCPGVPIVLREKSVLPLASPLVGSIHELVDLPAAS
jgi:hypothetical protein